MKNSPNPPGVPPAPAKLLRFPMLPPELDMISVVYTGLRRLIAR